jgi:hypothetical protein
MRLNNQTLYFPECLSIARVIAMIPQPVSQVQNILRRIFREKL